MMCISKKCMCLISVVLLLGIAGNTLAADKDYTNGGGNRLWRNSANWNGGVPTSADKAAIRGNFATNGPIIDSSTTAVANQIVCGDWSSAQDSIEMNGGTLTTSGTSCWFILGYGSANNGTFTISGGTVNAGSTLYVGFSGRGTINMTGGQIYVASTFGVAQNSGGIGDVYLNGGTISCASLNITSGGGIDLGGGTLLINGDATSQVNGYISSGLITAYAGSGTVSVDYNVTNPGKTTVVGVAPGKASYPNPGNGAQGVSINPTLSWTAGTGATSHDVYFGTSSPGTFKGNQTATTYSPGTLQLNTTYYWRIDEHNSGGTVTGDVWTFTTQTGTAVLRKGPYLIYPAVNTQMSVLWQLNSADTCTIEWGTDTSYSLGSANVPEYGTDHQYRYDITGLSPGTKYFYKVTTSSGINTGSFHAAPAANATNVKFFMYGDTRSHPAYHDSVCARMTSIYTDDSDYQTIALHAGDWVEADNENTWTSQWFTGDSTTTHLYEFIRNVPLAGCIGNHEGSANVWKKYWPGPFSNQPRYNYSFDYGPVHITILDQYTAYTSPSTQYTWLNNDLNNTTKQWKILVLHEPGWSAYGSGAHGNNTTVQNVIQPLCQTYDVQIVLAGHNHFYSRCAVDLNGSHTIQHVTNGAGGADFYGIDLGRPYVVTATANTPATCKVDIQGNTLTCTTLRADNGEQLDSFVLTQGAPPPPGQASNPSPTNGAGNVSTTADLSWTAGSDATSHDVYFGTSSPGAFQGNQTATTFDTGTMAAGTTYYWRIDEKNDSGTTTGVVWSFTTAAPPPPPGQASNPNPSNGAGGVSTTADLSWTAGSNATSHDVYFGTSSPGVFQGNQTATTFDTGTMAVGTQYYWRIDEKNDSGTTTGAVWSFTTTSTVTLFSDGFESGNFTAGGWTTQNSDASVATAAKYTGTYGAKLAKTTWMQKAVSTVGRTNIHVKYARKTKSMSGSVNLTVEWSVDGSTWYNLETTQQSSWASQDLTCASGANNNANFRVRWRTNGTKTTQYAYVDDVEITGQ